MNIGQYITSGIIESYVMGLASPEEAAQLERLLPYYPALQDALADFSFQLELYAIQHEEPPPPGVLEKIQDRVRELPAVRNPVYRGNGNGSHGHGTRRDEEFIYARESSTHIRVHKNYRIGFIALIILAKLLLAAFLYYFISFNRSEQDLRSMKQQQAKTNRAALSPETQESEK